MKLEGECGRLQLAQIEAAVDELFSSPRKGDLVDGRRRRRRQVGTEARLAAHQGHAPTNWWDTLVGLFAIYVIVRMLTG